MTNETLTPADLTNLRVLLSDVPGRLRGDWVATRSELYEKLGRMLSAADRAAVEPGIIWKMYKADDGTYDLHGTYFGRPVSVVSCDSGTWAYCHDGVTIAEGLLDRSEAIGELSSYLEP